MTAFLFLYRMDIIVDVFNNLLFLSLNEFIEPDILHTQLFSLLLVIINVQKGLLYVIFHVSFECFLFPNPLKHWIEPIFNLVLSPPAYFLRDLRPLITDLIPFH